MGDLGLNQSIFPVINDLELFKSSLGDNKPEIRFIQEQGLTIVSYMISKDDTFDSVYAREARGLTFDQDGKIVSRHLHKFFNVNERPETLMKVLPWLTVQRVMVKRDGSMISTVAVPSTDGQWNHCLKTKKTISSAILNQVNDWLDALGDQGNNYRKFCDVMVSRELTAIFEWTAPINRIVLSYPQAALTLLHVRQNHTGCYLTQGELSRLVAEFKIPLVAEDPIVLAMIKRGENEFNKYIAELTGVEGWVIQFETGEMVKIKTPWYLERHRIITFMRERDIAEWAITDKLDDIKSLLVGDGIDITELLVIETAAINQITALIKRVETAYDTIKHLDRKAAVEALKSNPLNSSCFGLIMTLFSGKDPQYKTNYLTHHLKEDFSLRPLNFLNQTEPSS